MKRATSTSPLPIERFIQHALSAPIHAAIWRFSSINVQEDLTPIKFGDAANLKKGQIVVTLGNPYAIARDGQVSASWGIIANLRRKAPPKSTKRAPRQESTDSSVWHVDSNRCQAESWHERRGMVNLKGEMIGLTISLAAVAGYEQAAGYAIPVDETFRRVIDTLEAGS